MPGFKSRNTNCTRRSSLNSVKIYCRASVPEAGAKVAFYGNALQFRFLLTLEQFFQRGSRLFLVVNHTVHFVDNRSVNLESARALPSASRSGNPFGHHFHGRHDLSKWFASPEALANSVIAAALAVACQNEITSTA